MTKLVYILIEYEEHNSNRGLSHTKGLVQESSMSILKKHYSLCSTFLIHILFHLSFFFHKMCLFTSHPASFFGLNCEYKTCIFLIPVENSILWKCHLWLPCPNPFMWFNPLLELGSSIIRNQHFFFIIAPTLPYWIVFPCLSPLFASLCSTVNSHP